MLGRRRSKETFSQGDTMSTRLSLGSTLSPSGSGPSSMAPRRRSGMGFVAAILVFMMGIGLFFMQKIIPGVIAVVCAALIVKADGIVTSLGLLF